MLSELAIAACLAMGPSQCSTCGPGGGGGMEFSPGAASGSWSAGGGPGNPYDAVSMGGGGGGDQLYPFDSPEPWLHGWFQEMPAYGGYHTFRPHNYKHVVAQMDVAGRWGISPVMPYSHQWYHPFRQRAGMHPDFGHQQASNEISHPGLMSAPVSLASTPTQTANLAYSQPQPEVQPVAAYHRGYTGTPIPGISTPYYQVPAPASPASQEYLDRLDQLQKQLEQQTFQMQVMQEQMRNQPPALSSLQPWQLPNYAHFPEYQQPQPQQPQQPQVPQGYQPQSYQAPAMVPQGYQTQGYQEVPVPPTGGFAVQPSYGAGSYVPSGPAGSAPSLAPTGNYGGNALPNLSSPYGAGGYQPGFPPMGANPNAGPMMMPAPATSMLAPGMGYFSQEGTAPYANPTMGYQHPNSNGAAHANFSYSAPQPAMVSPSNMAPSWAAPNQAQQTQAFNPAAAAASQQPNQLQPQQQSNSSGFRPFGRFLR